MWCDCLILSFCHYNSIVQWFRVTVRLVRMCQFHRIGVEALGLSLNLKKLLNGTKMWNFQRRKPCFQLDYHAFLFNLPNKLLKYLYLKNGRVFLFHTEANLTWKWSKFTVALSSINPLCKMLFWPRMLMLAVQHETLRCCWKWFILSEEQTLAQSLLTNISKNNSMCCLATH